MAGNGKTSDRTVWIDCEMTALDFRAESLSEFSAVVTDPAANVPADGVAPPDTPSQVAPAHKHELSAARQAHAGPT